MIHDGIEFEQVGIELPDFCDTISCDDRHDAQHGHCVSLRLRIQRCPNWVTNATLAFALSLIGVTGKTAVGTGGDDIMISWARHGMTAARRVEKVSDDKLQAPDLANVLSPKPPNTFGRQDQA
ncbi:hypothetical protein MesoLjLc_63870 [Mesorhizobium sp. L-8-10]|nr:hypothetical protein MesoLjLc_63870 [Mesorhizobium sp. L-8-10]